MDIYVLNQDFEKVRVIDNYSSLIWNEKYYEPGDFQLVMPFSKIEDFADIVIDNYLQIADSEYTMIIESIVITTSSEDGYSIKVTGKDLTSILARRVTWGTYSYDTFETNEGWKKLLTAGEVLKDLLDRSFGSEALAPRKVEKFVWDLDTDAQDELYKHIDELEDVLKPRSFYYRMFDPSTARPYYFDGENLSTIFTTMGKEFRFGTKIIYNEDTGNMELHIFTGVDRSYAQYDNDYVLFSEEMSNIYNTNYSLDYSNYKSVAVIAVPCIGVEPEEHYGDSYPNLMSQYIFEQNNGDDAAKTGLKRRELYLSSTNGEHTPKLDEANEKLVNEYASSVRRAVDALYTRCAENMINRINEIQTSNGTKHTNFKLKKVKDESEMEEHQSKKKDSHRYIYMIQDETARKDQAGADHSGIMNWTYNAKDNTKHWKLYFPTQKPEDGSATYNSPCYDLGSTEIVNKKGETTGYKLKDKVNKYSESQINDALDRWFEYIRDAASDASLNATLHLGETGVNAVDGNYILNDTYLIKTPEQAQNNGAGEPGDHSLMESGKIYIKPDPANSKDPATGTKPMEQVWLYFDAHQPYNSFLRIDDPFYVGAVGGDFINSLFLTLSRDSGRRQFDNNNKVENFEGELDTSIQYVYGKDYKLGDVVEVQNVLGQWAQARVTGIVRSYSSSGVTAIPSFTMLSKEDADYKEGSYYRYSHGAFEMLRKDYKY